MNSISKQILQSHQFLWKSLMGGILIFSIIGIPFFIGYMARYLHQIRDHNNFELPQWNHWLALLIESWELLLAVLIYGVIPGGFFSMMSHSIDGYVGFLWPIIWLPTMLCALISPMLVTISYQQYLTRGTLDSLFDIPQAYQTFLSTVEELIPYTLMLWGAWFIGFPIFGFTISISLIIYIPVTLSAIARTR